MIKIKVTWKYGGESYVMAPRQYTQFIDKAKDYHSVAIAARTARQIQRTDDLVKQVNIVTAHTTYNVW